ncbi:MAG: hypothetical protein MUE72_06890, partial [Chitinophagaceae bacterium]|nr:hypothetical protein [Chitinophagaceae bacterium]
TASSRATPVHSGDSQHRTRCMPNTSGVSPVRANLVAGVDFFCRTVAAPPLSVVTLTKPDRLPFGNMHEYKLFLMIGNLQVRWHNNINK